MKKFLLSIILAILLIAPSANAEFFRDIVVTSPNAIWTDSRAYTTLNAAIIAIGANDREIVIVNEQIVTTLTVPSNVRLKFLRDGSIANLGQLTINTRNISADSRQIFTGIGDIDFASGSVVKSTWFSDLDEAFDVTSDDTLTMIISKAETTTADMAVGNNVTLRWESPFIITVAVGHTVSNLKNIEAGNYQIFAGAGEFNFLAGTELSSYWFTHLKTAIDFIDSDQVNLTIVQTENLDDDRTIDVNTNLVIKKGGMVSIDAGRTLTINGSFDAGLYQVFTGAGDVKFTNNTNIHLDWWPSTNWSTSLKSAIDSLSTAKGGQIDFLAKTYEFATPVVDGTPIGDNIIFQGQGCRGRVSGDDTYGTVLKYTGTDTLFKIYLADGFDRAGEWHWRDMAIWCTSTGSAIELNDTSRFMTTDATSPNYILRCSFENLMLKGNGGDYGLAALGMFNSFTDHNFFVSDFKYGVYLKDCDLNILHGRAMTNNQHVRIVTEGTNFCNANVVRIAMHPLRDYGEPLYAIYDKANCTKYEHTQIEVEAGQSPFYLNGTDTIFDSPGFSLLGAVTDAGYIDSDAKNIRFVRPCGGSVAGGTWDVQLPTKYYGTVNEGGDHNIYIENPAEFYKSCVPSNPRVVKMNYPTADEVHGKGGTSRNEAATHSLLAFMGLPGPHSTHMLINPFTKGFAYASYTGLTWVEDTDASTNWAFNLEKYTIGLRFLSRILTAGIMVNTDDVLSISIRYKTSAAVTGGNVGLQVYNRTTPNYILSWNMPAAIVNYQVCNAVVPLTAVNDNDQIEVRVYHTLTDAGGDSTLSIDYVSIVPIAKEVIVSQLRLAERSADPVQPQEGTAVIWMSDGTGKGDDGDVMIGSKAGGVAKYKILFDHSAGIGW